MSTCHSYGAFKEKERERRSKRHRRRRKKGEREGEEGGKPSSEVFLGGLPKTRTLEVLHGNKLNFMTVTCVCQY